MTWTQLFLDTIRTPDAVAEWLKGTEFERASVWMGLFAVAALGAVVTGLTVVLIPLPPGWPDMFAMPFAHFAASAGGMILFAQILTWAGRGLGGSGTLEEITKLVVWLQAVRVGLQILGLFLLVAIPVLGAFYGLATGLLAIWILIQFIKIGHGFDGAGAAIMVLLATFVGLVIALSMILSLLGVGTIGLTPNV